MDDATLLKQPAACTEKERRAFAHLVLQGFDAAPDTLDRRVRNAKWLAFHYASGDTLAAIAALKAPDDRYRQNVFEKAGASDRSIDYALELGWVFVAPAHRRNAIATTLCRLLMERAPTARVFATTRPDNDPMIRILVALNFVRVGQPFARRDEKLSLFLRTSPCDHTRR